MRFAAAATRPAWVQTEASSSASSLTRRHPRLASLEAETSDVLSSSSPSTTTASTRRPSRQRRGILSLGRSSSSASSLTLLLFALVTSCSSVVAKQKILIYTRTAGYRHLSIPTAVANVKELADQNNVITYATEDESKLENKKWLFGFDALVFISVSGQMLSPDGIDNVRDYIEAGGGFFSAHEACDAMYHTPWYGRLVGAYFNYHPEITHAELDITKANSDHPSVAHLGKTWKVYDEMYNFNSDPRKLGFQTVITVDDHSYNDPVESISDRIAAQGGPHPLAWFKEGDLLTDPAGRRVGGGVDNVKADIKKGIQGVGGAGRAFYTGLGHTKAQWEDDDFQQHVWGAISWVLDSQSIQSNSGNKSQPGTEFTPAKGHKTTQIGADNSTSSNITDDNTHPLLASAATDSQPQPKLAPVAITLATLLSAAAISLV